MATADFFRARIDEMINLKDPLAVLATRLPWDQIEAAQSAKFERQARVGQLLQGQDMFGPTQELQGAGISNAGRPKLPIRLMASLLYLKHSLNLSDEELVVRWSENVLWQFFSGMAYYEHRLPCDATQIGRFRRDLGEDGMEQLLKVTLPPKSVSLAEWFNPSKENGNDEDDEGALHARVQARSGATGWGWPEHCGGRQDVGRGRADAAQLGQGAPAGQAHRR
jgi:hypothetical protein